MGIDDIAILKDEWGNFLFFSAELGCTKIRTYHDVINKDLWHSHVSNRRVKDFKEVNVVADNVPQAVQKSYECFLRFVKSKEEVEETSKKRSK